MVKRVLIPAKYRREGLKLKDFACVINDVAKYPLKPKGRVLNAMARYMQPQTSKCKKGLKKICKAYEKHGLEHTTAYKQQCHI
ncbi:hypothetical protein MUP77_17410 [Candidatus Bathyarchaeota archaeon]|nr:hypothetical protein [Candidatus Bathyarchaeota archaeon]